MKFCGEDIYNVIPNRKPLMLLDSLEVIKNTEGEDVSISEIVLREDSWFFACHYPGNPVLPLSLLLESMIQTFSALFVSQSQEIPLIASISEVRLKDKFIPGDRVRIEACLKSFRRGIAKGKCMAFKNDNDSPSLEIEIVEVLPSLMKSPVNREMVKI